MHTVPTSAMPVLGDGYDQDGLVAVAWYSLNAFGGEPLARSRVAVLLSMWRHFTELSEDQLKAVLSRFPEATTPVPAQILGHKIGTRHGGAS